jgi:hypothetical protein
MPTVPLLASLQDSQRQCHTRRTKSVLPPRHVLTWAARTRYGTLSETCNGVVPLVERIQRIWKLFAERDEVCTSNDPSTGNLLHSTFQAQLSSSRDILQNLNLLLDSRLACPPDCRLHLN